MKKLFAILSVLCVIPLGACSRADKASVSVADSQVYKWGDFRADDGFPPDENEPLKLRMADYPDTEFSWSSFGITASGKDGEKSLVSGMPVWSAYFADLNGDSYPELCSGVCFGSGIVDEHIVVYDVYNGQQYMLWDRMEYDYILSFENGQLTVEKVPYGSWHESDVQAETGTLTIENGELIMKPTN